MKFGWEYIETGQFTGRGPNHMFLNQEQLLFLNCVGIER